MKLEDWCLVVVLDKRSKPTYSTGWTKGKGHRAVVILTPEDQENMANTFVDQLPYNSFGRKNVGYLYAIEHGAKVIWDFDDDNSLKFWLTGAAPPGAPSLDNVVAGVSEEKVTVLELDDHKWPTYNPYPVLGAPSLPSWPRGFPLEDIKKNSSRNARLKSAEVETSSIGVLQSLAEHQPDVDAIFRLTMPVPFNFNRSTETRHLLVPPGSYTPYNAQATLHFEHAFFALFLPVTVTGRVSDIWRGYVSQRLFRDAGLRFGFTSRPLVVQNRNQHNIIADFDAEAHLYTRAKQLIKYLNAWEGSGESLVTRIEELWIALYEREYIELEDVKLVQLWLQCLIDFGYKFPKLIDIQGNNDVYFYPTVKTDDIKDEFKASINKTLTIWTSDQHTGSRTDAPTLLTNLGQHVIKASRKGAVEKDELRHPGVYDKIDVHRNVSGIIEKSYLGHTTRLTESMIKENYEFFKTQPEIASTDIFLCQFPSSMCEMWMPFNKTIAFVPVHRYNLGRCNRRDWERLDQHLRMLVSSTSPAHIIGAGSVYDQEYLHHYTGLSPSPLYSTCVQYTKPALHPYRPTRNEILFVSHLGTNKKTAILSEVRKFEMVELYSLYPLFTWGDLSNHRALVYIPYSVMSYKLCDFYSLGIPLFVPSIRFYRTISTFGKDHTILTTFYCNNTKIFNNLPDPNLDEIMKPHPSSTHPYSPNADASTDLEAENYWLQMSDFYEWPHITTFDNASDLERKLESANFHQIHDLMMKEVERKREAVSEMWAKALSRVETGRIVPKDYKTALKKLYGVERLQVQ